jgi:hypothetical protein
VHIVVAGPAVGELVAAPVGFDDVVAAVAVDLGGLVHGLRDDLVIARTRPDLRVVVDEQVGAVLLVTQMDPGAPGPGARRDQRVDVRAAAARDEPRRVLEAPDEAAVGADVQLVGLTRGGAVRRHVAAR